MINYETLEKEGKLVGLLENGNVQIWRINGKKYVTDINDDVFDYKTYQEATK